MSTISLRAPAIECEGCARSIDRSLKRLAGVESVSVDVDTKFVEVGYDPSRTGPTDIMARLSAAGFPAEPVSP